MTETATGPERYEVRMTSDSHFSWLRTRLSVERTLMAWIRTATALIGFGFTIVQFFERFAGMSNVEVAQRPQAPRYLGLGLIAAGLLALLISCWQYHWVTNYLSSGPFQPIAGLREGEMQTPVFAIAIILMFIGLFAFVAVFTRAI